MVFEKIKSIVADQLDVDEADIKLESSFTKDLGADSLDMVELLMALEEKMGVSIPDEDTAKLRTVGDAVAYIESKS